MAKARKSPTPRGTPARSRATLSREPATPGADLLRMAGVMLVCAIIWITVYNRWSSANWGVPLEYGLKPETADVRGNLAGFRAAQDGHYWPFLLHFEPRLGAPFTANWNDYPVTEDFLIAGTGVLAMAIGLFPASNFLILFGQMLAAAAFYYTARRLKCDWKWSFAGGLFFALAPYAFAHSLHHFVITYYWHVSLGLLVCCWLATGPGLRFRSRDYWIAFGIAVVTGWQNVYYTNIFIQLVGITLIIQWVRHGWRAALVPFSIGCAAFAAFLTMNLDTFGYAFLHGPNPGSTVRNYAQMEYYGLKLVDCMVPFPTHKLGFLGALGHRFYNYTILPAEEPPACYFGLAGIAAFLWLCIGTVRCAIVRPARKVPVEAVLALWTLLYSTVGGVNAMLGVLNFQMFRSTTRYCIVLFCLALLFAVRRLTLISRRWRSPWPTLAPLGIAVLGLWEFLPPVASQEEIDLNGTVVESDRRFAQAMEAKLPPRSMVFQLPVMDFPESPAPGISAYDHFRPFYFTNGLRFSYGTDKGRPRDSWQNVITTLTPAAQIEALERYGFAAIYVNRAGYPDHGEAILSQFKAAGRSEVLESPLHDLYCVVLHPSATPVLPPPGPFFARGWYGEQDDLGNGRRDRMAFGDATLILTNPGDAPVTQYASFYLASAAPRNVTMTGAGVAQNWRITASEPAQIKNLPVTLQPGENVISIKTDAPPTRQQAGLITFDVINFTLTESRLPE